MLERILGPADAPVAVSDVNVNGPAEERWERENPNSSLEGSFCTSGETSESVSEEQKEEFPQLREQQDQCDSTEKISEVSNGPPPEPVRTVSPQPVPSDLLASLTQLATLYTELSCFRNHENEQALGCTTFLRRYFFLLDHERVRRMCLLCYQQQPEVQSSFIEGMLGE